MVLRKQGGFWSRWTIKVHLLGKCSLPICHQQGNSKHYLDLRERILPDQAIFCRLQPRFRLFREDTTLQTPI